MLQNSSLLLRKSIWLTLPALIVFLSAGTVLAAEPNGISTKVGEVAGDPNSQIEQICSAIYKGDIAGARGLLGGSEKSKSTAITQLINVISEYEAIEKRRQLAREAAYKEQLAELEKLRAKIPTPACRGGIPPAGNWLIGEWLISGDANNPPYVWRDGNDVNNITAALLVITRACEYAQPSQKEQLLSDAFVKGVLQKAIDKAAGFEVKGKWLEAYTNCYYWLQAIEPNNKTYLDYAEQLLDKAGIAASFQDSPCETREQRYAGVQKEMFVRAIDALSLSYVSIIDYGQMATKAIERCKLLAEVMAVSAEGDPNKMQLKTAEVAAWSASLAALADEVHQSPTGFDKDKFIGVFEKVLALNTATIELPVTALIAQFAEAALSALDPYTVMVWPRQVQDFEKTMTNEFTGIGIEITKEKGLLTVASLLPDTPAYKAGLDAGDVIEAVDGLETKDMALVCAVRKITGPKNTKVTLTIRREGEEKTKDFTITRDKITVPTIRGWQRTEEGKWLYLIPDSSLLSVRSSSTTNNEQRTMNGIGYVQITSFSAQTASDLEEVLNQLEAGPVRKESPDKSGLKISPVRNAISNRAGELRGLILDLRFNSGGLLDSAVDVADKFLKKGLIVKTQPGSGFPTYAVAHEGNTHPDYPLVILINSGSASASEIVAGALADAVHKRAILVGERTHGKGSVQGITHYPGGDAQLKYTMAYYYLPSGQRVESPPPSRQVETVGGIKKQGRPEWGVGPNIEVELTSDELKKMIDVQRDNDVLAQADRGNAGREVKKHTIEETLTADPQLAIGVLTIKTKLIQADSVSVHSY